MKRSLRITILVLGFLLIGGGIVTAVCMGLSGKTAMSAPVWEFCRGTREGLETAVITGYEMDCEAGRLPVGLSAAETEDVRRLAMSGVVTGKANDMSVTGGTWVYSFDTPEGEHLLTIELYKGLLVGMDGMYSIRYDSP